MGRLTSPKSAANRNTGPPVLPGVALDPVGEWPETLQAERRSRFPERQCERDREYLR